MENKHKEFKPYDRVLMRGSVVSEWVIELYSHYDKDRKRHETMCHYCNDDCNILPYEGNEHLVGTTDEPGEEIKLEEGELLVISDFSENFTVKVDAYNLQAFHHLNINCFECYNGNLWKYAIRFTDFNPNNMEETKKHILCVKNGKIVKHHGKD